MRTEPVEQYKGSLKGSRLVQLFPSEFDDLNHYSIKASGSDSTTSKAPGMLSRISTFISKKLSSSLNLSSRDARWLSISYWTCMGLSCIGFFIFPWYLFLAFLIPALIMLLMREVHKLSTTCSNYKGPA